MKHTVFYREVKAGGNDVIAISITAEPFMSLGRETVRAIGIGKDGYGNIDVGQPYLDKCCDKIDERKARVLAPSLFTYIREHTPS